MAIVWVPALVCDLVNGLDKIIVNASTIQEAIDKLETSYPGFKKRMYSHDDLRDDIMILVDGEISYQGLRQKLLENNEIFFLPALGSE